MSWTELRDQDGAIALLTRAIAADRVAPAYLFVGPPSVGKALAARIMTQALNCEEGPGAACGACATCHTIASGNHPDLLWARPEKRSRTIPVELVRSAIRTLALAPQAGRRRVAVFDNADCMHPAGQNALLKTLEEPAGRTHLLLVTATPAALLPTVRSRCQLVRFRPLEPHTIANLLQRDGVAPETARLAAAAANGGVAPARLLADTGRVDFLLGLLQRAVDGEAAAAAAEHTRDLDRHEKSLEKAADASEIDPELLSREQRKRLDQERIARVQQAMTERVEADVRILALVVRDGIAQQATGTADLCVLGEPLPAFASAAPAALTRALRELDRGLTYLRQYIRRDRVLFAMYTALQDAGRVVAA